MHKQIFYSLDDIFQSGTRGMVVGFEQTFPRKTYNFSPFRDIVHYSQHLRSLFPLKKTFLHHEIIHRYISTCKVVFDIDIKKGASLELYQEVQDKLISSLLSIFPDLDLETEIGMMIVSSLGMLFSRGQYREKNRISLISTS